MLLFANINSALFQIFVPSLIPPPMTKSCCQTTSHLVVMRLAQKPPEVKEADTRATIWSLFIRVYPCILSKPDLLCQIVFDYVWSWDIR